MAAVQFLLRPIDGERRKRECDGAALILEQLEKLAQKGEEGSRPLVGRSVRTVERLSGVEVARLAALGE